MVVVDLPVTSVRSSTSSDSVVRMNAVRTASVRSGSISETLPIIVVVADAEAAGHDDLRRGRLEVASRLVEATGQPFDLGRGRMPSGHCGQPESTGEDGAALGRHAVVRVGPGTAADDCVRAGRQPRRTARLGYGASARRPVSRPMPQGSSASISAPEPAPGPSGVPAGSSGSPAGPVVGRAGGHGEHGVVRHRYDREDAVLHLQDGALHRSRAVQFGGDLYQ